MFWICLIAAPARDGTIMNKSRRKQSAKDAAAHAAGLEAQAASVTAGGRASRAKPQAKAEDSDKTKESAPHGVCFEWWDHGKCAQKESGVECKWPHVRSNHPDAAICIANATAAAKAKQKGQVTRNADGTAHKPKI